jgi:hypothetical protein
MEVLNVAEPLDRNLHLLEVLPQLGQAQHRLRHLRGDHVEGDKSADGHFAVEDGLCAKQQKERVRQFADVLDGVLAFGGEHGRLERRADVGGQTLFPLSGRHRFDGRGLNRLHSDNRFDQELLAFRAAVEPFVEFLAQKRARHRRDQDVKGDRRQHNHRQLPGVGEEDCDEDEGEQEIKRREKALPGQEGPDRFQFANARDGLPRRPGFEIGDRQAGEMAEQALS